MGVDGVSYPKLKDVIPLVVSPGDEAFSTTVHRYLSGVSHGSPQGVMSSIDVHRDATKNEADGVVRLNLARVASEVCLAASAFLRTFNTYIGRMGWDKHAATRRASDVLIPAHGICDGVRPIDRIQMQLSSSRDYEPCGG